MRNKISTSQPLKFQDLSADRCLRIRQIRIRFGVRLNLSIGRPMLISNRDCDELSNAFLE